MDDLIERLRADIWQVENLGSDYIDAASRLRMWEDYLPQVLANLESQVAAMREAGQAAVDAYEEAEETGGHVLWAIAESAINTLSTTLSALASPPESRDGGERRYAFGYPDGTPGTPEYEPPAMICTWCGIVRSRCRCPGPLPTEAPTAKGEGE